MEAAVIDQEASRSGMVVLILDTTEKQEAEKRRREFTANVTHELKTPLQTISSSAELLGSGMVQEADVSRFAGYISQEAARMTTLINDIIHLSRLDEQESPGSQITRLDEALLQAAGQLSGMAEMEGITLQVHTQPASVRASQHDLQDIVMNLLENAIKYNHPGGWVQADLRTENGKAVLEVSDGGEGISEKDQQRIFERFYRADKSHSRARGGSGLGLAIVLHAVNNLGGTIHLDSQEKKAPGSPCGCLWPRRSQPECRDRQDPGKTDKGSLPVKSKDLEQRGLKAGLSFFCFLIRGIWNQKMRFYDKKLTKNDNFCLYKRSDGRIKNLKNRAFGGG